MGQPCIIQPTLAFRMLGIGLLCMAVLVPPLYGMEAEDCGFDDRLLEVNKTERSGWDPDENKDFDWSEYEIGSSGVISVPYYFDPWPSRAVRSAVEEGLRYVEENMSCIKFKETPKDFYKKQLEIRIAHMDRCEWTSSWGGAVGTFSQTQWGGWRRTQWGGWRRGHIVTSENVYLRMGRAPCLRYRHWNADSIETFTTWYQIFVHEVFHVFGIAHTMKRVDRDDYVNVLYENIPNTTNALHQYEIDALIPVPNIPYECNSIMHYHRYIYENMTGYNFNAIDPETCKFNKKEPTVNDWKALKYNTCAKLEGFSE